MKFIWGVRARNITTPRKIYFKKSGVEFFDLKIFENFNAIQTSSCFSVVARFGNFNSMLCSVWDNTRFSIGGWGLLQILPSNLQNTKSTCTSLVGYRFLGDLFKPPRRFRSIHRVDVLL